jgi:tryptophanyl-tRNA synthetase
VRHVLAEYLACGLDPGRCTLYIQSDLPQTAELYLLLNMNAYVGELERATTFKEKIRSQPDNINAGLLTYPVLMAADILIHRAHKVPVGKDQEQHLEMTRTFGNRFNRLYGAGFFPEPAAYNFGKELVKVPGLDGSGKMGKSEGEGNALFLSDPPDAIRKKVMRAVTDAGPTRPGQEKQEAIANLFAIMRLVSSADTVAFFESKYDDCSIRYGDMKKQLAEDAIAFLAPLAGRIRETAADQALLDRVMVQGREKAAQSADATMAGVRRLIGFSV